MADLSNLRTASLYINNQLLSRGLSRNGTTINFAEPGAGAGDALDNTAATMKQIVAIVNDLLLRRDRDAEQRESMSAALRTARADTLRQANDLARALEREAEAQRRASLGEASEMSLRAQLAAAEASNRKLREEAARMRQLVAQTRASCAHDVRKRDRQIDALKKAVADAGRARGERRSAAITTITIVGGTQQTPSRSAFATPNSVPPMQSTPVSAAPMAATMAATIASASASVSASAATMTSVSAPPALESTDYDLRTETNAFLADLARDLSDDNEALLGLVHATLRALKDMSGFAPGGDDDVPGTDCGVLAQDMDVVLEHLRTILTNPSFVPIEEVVQRETEIGRLRDGWEKMEDRWKEAVHLLDGWRQRMANDGRAINLEEIKMGLRLSPVRVRNVAETVEGRLDDVVDEHADHADSLHLVPARADDDTTDTSSALYDESEPNVQIIEQSALLPPDLFGRPSRSPTPPAQDPVKPARAPIRVDEADVETEARSDKPKAGTTEQPRAFTVQVRPKTVAKVVNETEAASDKTARKTQPALKPSQTAGNRGGLDAPKPAVRTAPADVRKDGKKAADTDRPTLAKPGTRPLSRPASRATTARTASRPPAGAASRPKPTGAVAGAKKPAS